MDTVSFRQQAPNKVLSQQNRTQAPSQKKTLANPFGAMRVQATSLDNDGDFPETFDQPIYQSQTRNNGRVVQNPFPQNSSYKVDTSADESVFISNVNNSTYPQSRTGMGAQSQPQFSKGFNDDFISVEPATQVSQTPSTSGSFLGSIMGFASLLPAANQVKDSRQGPEFEEEDEPPLLEDLGIDLKLIKMRTLSVLKFQKCQEEFVNEADMSGPLLLFLALGSLLLFSGKVHFGYIYGFGVFGAIAVYVVMNLLSQHYKAQLYNTVSILGYCLFPIVVLAFFNVFFNLVNLFGFIMVAVAIGWATLAATNFFQVLLRLEDQKWLIAYPIFLFYKIFVIITIF